MNQLSPWYQSRLAPHIEPALRGTLVIAIRDWVDERLALGSFTRLARRHDSDWSDALVDAAWYSARTVLATLEHALRYDESSEDVAEEIVSACARDLLRHGCAVESSKRPTALLQQGDLLLRCLMNFGSVESELNLHGLYDGWIHGIPSDLEPMVRGLWQGFMPALLADSSAKELRCAVVLSERGVFGKRLYVRCRYR